METYIGNFDAKKLYKLNCTINSLSNYHSWSLVTFIGHPDDNNIKTVQKCNKILFKNFKKTILRPLPNTRIIQFEYVNNYNEHILFNLFSIHLSNDLIKYAVNRLHNFKPYYHHRFNSHFEMKDFINRVYCNPF